VARELTKTHEEYLRFRLESVPDLSEILGEVTVIIGPPEAIRVQAEKRFLPSLLKNSLWEGPPRAVAPPCTVQGARWTRVRFILFCPA
jgi:16S rRNA (cytidine1402-2'-O)-methyltransferase